MLGTVLSHQNLLSLATNFPLITKAWNDLFVFFVCLNEE